MSLWYNNNKVIGYLEGYKRAKRAKRDKRAKSGGRLLF